MELNPFYQSDDDYEDERLDISNGNGNVENHDYEDEQLDISSGNVRVGISQNIYTSGFLGHKNLHQKCVICDKFNATKRA